VHAKEILDAVLSATSLTYGDYDSVAFTTSIGAQQFRALAGCRHGAAEAVVEVPCVEVTFYISQASDTLSHALAAVYNAHPYEEPVILINEILSTRHVKGVDDDNPNRFWNRDTPDWVPEIHR